MFKSCEVSLLQVESLQYQFYELPPHSWIKFQGNKSLETAWRDYFNETHFDSRFLEYLLPECYWNRYKDICSVKLFQQ